MMKWMSFDLKQAARAKSLPPKSFKVLFEIKLLTVTLQKAPTEVDFRAYIPNYRKDRFKKIIDNIHQITGMTLDEHIQESIKDVEKYEKQKEGSRQSSQRSRQKAASFDTHLTDKVTQKTDHLASNHKKSDVSRDAPTLHNNSNINTPTTPPLSDDEVVVGCGNKNLIFKNQGIILEYVDRKWMAGKIRGSKLAYKAGIERNLKKDFDYNMQIICDELKISKKKISDKPDFILAADLHRGIDVLTSKSDPRLKFKNGEAVLVGKHEFISDALKSPERLQEITSRLNVIRAFRKSEQEEKEAAVSVA